jgi:hypothetical protein
MNLTTKRIGSNRVDLFNANEKVGEIVRRIGMRGGYRQPHKYGLFLFGIYWTSGGPNRRGGMTCKGFKRQRDALEAAVSALSDERLALPPPLATVTDQGKPPQETPLEHARALRQEIVDLDLSIENNGGQPTADDYRHLYQIANCGVIELLKLLGDTTDFGDSPVWAN